MRPKGPECMWGGFSQVATIPNRPPVTPIPDSRLERLREKAEPSLGEINPLIFPPNLLDPQAIDALSYVIREKIKQYQGLEPTLMETVVIPIPKEQPVARFITRFEVGSLDEYQVVLLERLVAETYPSSVRTRTDINGNFLQPTAYNPLETARVVKRGRKGAFGSGFMGWYMGPDIKPTTTLHTGMYIYRDIGDSKVADYLRSINPKDWFFDPNLQTPLRKALENHYVVEIREQALFSTDLVQLVAQVSSVLGRGQSIDNPHLLYEIYNDLNRLGLRKAPRTSIQGLDGVIADIERSLILPLANLDLSTGLELRPGSVLMVGVPGTGKTLLVEHLLQLDTGVFLVPVVPKQLSDDLSRVPQSRTLLPRIAHVFRKTGIPVILQLDDIESLGTDNKQINSTLLNLMAGVREHGFFVIASTNHPESLSPQLLQPERFATIVYFGLHDQPARKRILNVHATEASRELGRELFKSPQERDLILEALSNDEATNGFTPRFLAEICTVAKKLLLERTSMKKGKKVGLSEKDLEDTFSAEDWAQALGMIAAGYDKREVKEWDENIQKFVKKHIPEYGVNRMTRDSSQQSFMAAYQRLVNAANLDAVKNR